MSKAYLTIDDISTKLTPKFMDYLNERGITPIMFSIGCNIEEHYDEALYALRKGAIIGNHSYSHPHFSEISYEACVEEIEKEERILNDLYQAAGVERKYKIFRFPYGDKGGENKDKIQAYLKEQGFCRIDDSSINYDWYKEWGLNKDIDVYWTFDFSEYQLWFTEGFTYDNVLERIHDTNPEYGGVLLDNEAMHIILMHDHEESDAIMPDYYKTILDYVISQGVEFVEPKFLVS